MSEKTEIRLDENAQALWEIKAEQSAKADEEAGRCETVALHLTREQTARYMSHIVRDIEEALADERFQDANDKCFELQNVASRLIDNIFHRMTRNNLPF